MRSQPHEPASRSPDRTVRRPGLCGQEGQSRAPRFAAFTLIELILVMALLAIVLAVSAPSFSNFFHGRALDSEARRFVGLTHYAQSRAVSEGVPMVLWLKPRLDRYGLQEQPGYTERDTKTLEYQLGKDLTIAVEDVPVLNARLLSAQTRLTAQALRSDPATPKLLFLPDGFLGETSPQSVIIREKGGASIVISQSRNRLNYEIQTNSFRNALR